METNLTYGGVPPSALALKNSLSPKPATSFEETMLTASQLELLQQLEKEIDEYLEKALQLEVASEPLKASAAGAAD